MPSTDGFIIIKGLTVFKTYQPKSLGNMLKIINTDTEMTIQILELRCTIFLGFLYLTLKYFSCKIFTYFRMFVFNVRGSSADYKRKIFWINISYPHYTYTDLCVSGSKKYQFFGKLHVLLNGRSLDILRHYCSHHMATIQLVEIFQMHLKQCLTQCIEVKCLTH